MKGERMMTDKNIFSCSWDEFEDWIRQQIDGDFSWKIRPIDTRGNREAVVESIKKATRNNNGIFPETGDTFIEKRIEKE
jgi:hypothetical protein